VCPDLPVNKKTYALSPCKIFENDHRRHDQDGDHFATNNDALTGKFDVTTIELSAGRRRLQPPIEQL
jgi:hypothetical protein